MIIKSEDIDNLVTQLEKIVSDDYYIFELKDINETQENEIMWILYYHYSRKFILKTNKNINLTDYNVRFENFEIIDNVYIYKFTYCKTLIPQRKDIIKLTADSCRLGANFGSIFKNINGEWQLTRKSITDQMYIVGTFRNDSHNGFIVVQIEPYTWKYLSEMKIIEIQDNNVAIYEDPRCFIYKGELYLSHSHLIDSIAKVKLAVCKLDSEFKITKKWIPPFGNNINSNNSAWEKNWVFFEHEERLFCVYIPSPLYILEFNPIDFNVINASVDNYYERKNINKSFLCNTSPIFRNGKFHFFTHGPYNYNVSYMSFEVSNSGFKVSNISLDYIYKKQEDVYYYPSNTIWDDIRRQYILVGGWADRYPCVYTISENDIMTNNSVISL